MGKTITTYLIDGTPQGPRMVYVSNKNCMAIVVPRSKMSSVLNRKELHKYALYLEAKAIALALNNKQYVLDENKQNPTAHSNPSCPPTNDNVR